MSSHVFHQIYLHINWHIKDDRPTLVGDIELATHRFIKQRCTKTKGVYFHSIGGTATHIHLAINIEPHVTISELIQNLKGGSAHDLNTHFRRKELHWQRGYGVVSFGKNNLDWVVQYIASQKEHHAHRQVEERLERITDYEDA